MTDTIQGFGAITAMGMIGTGMYLLGGLGASLLLCGGLILFGIVEARKKLQ